MLTECARSASSSSALAERVHEKAVTRKNLHRMQTKFYLAEEVGARLGRSEILQQALQWRALQGSEGPFGVLVDVSNAAPDP